MIAIEQNKTIYTFTTREQITSRNCKAKGLVIKTTGLIYATDEELEALGFQNVIDAPFDPETQYLGAVQIKDGKFCRYPVDKPIPTPQETFNVSEAKDDIKALFLSNILELDRRYAIILDNLNQPLTDSNCEMLKDYSYLLRASKDITELQYLEFLAIFEKQNINLLNY